MSAGEEDSFLTRHIDTVRQHTRALYKNAQGVSWQKPELVIHALEELRVALEELHVAEEELQRQNEELLAVQRMVEAERRRYQELFEFAPDGYLVTDMYGVVQEANQIAGELLNVSSHRLLGKPLVTLVPEEYRLSFRTLLNQMPTINRVQEWEVKLCGRGNRVFDAALTVETVRNLDDQPTGLRWLLRDITARKQADEQLRQVQLQNLELKENDRLKNQFIATISHELRTPLSAILGFSQLVLTQLKRRGEHQLLSMVERIVSNGKHLLNLIEEILNYSALQAKQLELRPQLFDLRTLIVETVDELRSLADQKALPINLNLPPHEFIVVNDPCRLRQVLVNLISNAIKFTDSGSITVELLELPEGRILIIISDTGIGIAPSDYEQIFQEFWQVNQSITRLHGGTGLGLATSKALVELMQGSIFVESQVGRGSSFRIELPRRLKSHGGRKTWLE